MRFWDIKDGTEGLKIGPFESKVLWVGIMPNGSVEESKYLYIGLENRIIRYDTLLEAEAKSIKLPGSANELKFHCAVFNPPNQLIVGTEEGSIVQFDVWSGSVVAKSSKGHTGAVAEMVIDFVSGTLISISYDKTLKLWALSNLGGPPLRSTTLGATGLGLSSSLPYSLALGGDYVFVGVKQKFVLMYSLAALLAGGSGSDALARFSHPTSVTTLRVLEGTLVAVSGDVVYLWSISERAQVGTILESKDCFIQTLEVARDRIFCGSTDNCVHAFRFMPQATFKAREAARRKETDLSLTYCQLTTLPTMLSFSARLLTSLNLCHNSFSVLPPSIGSLQVLTTLQLSHNLLDTLPDELQQLSALQTLHLDHNRFKMVPLAIAGLSGLKTLNIAHNAITFLFPFLTLIPITTLDVTGNPLEDPTPDIVKAGLPAILDHLHTKSSTQAVTVDRVKVMLVGNENVGKTSLVLNLRHKSGLFSARPNIKTLSTQGISIEMVHSKPGTLNGAGGGGNAGPSVPTSASSPGSPVSPRDAKGLILNVASTPKDKKKEVKRKVKWYTWDFGGQEIYYNTHQFFITPHAIYVIAFNVTKPLDESNINFWLRCIKARTTTSRGTHSYSGDSSGNRAPVPVILVATHTDAFDKTQLPWLQDLFLVNSKEDLALRTRKDDAFLEVYFQWIQRKFATEHPSVKLVTGVSSKTGKGIKELKAAIRQIIDTDASIRKQVNSVVYERVFHFDALVQRAKTAAMPPFLTWAEYQTMALGCIDDQTHLLEVTKLLANLGSLVYLPSSSRKNSWMVSMAQLFPEDYETPPPSAEFVVLDPQWLVDLFATVLGTSPNFVRNGMIRAHDLNQIWRDQAKFPPHLHRQLMLILEHFDVAFALGSHRKLAIETNPVISGLPAPKLKEIAARNAGATRGGNPHTALLNGTAIPSLQTASAGQNSAHHGHQALQTRLSDSDSQRALAAPDEIPTHLFPSLLPTAKPQLDILWPEFEHRFQVDRIYTFPRFLPLGLFSRFMVRLLLYFPAFYYWRHGVVISDVTKRAYALIEETPSENKVSITVRGPVNAVSQFLTSVMDIWTKLVSDMYDVNVAMTTTCYHCTASKIVPPHVFDLSVCETLVASGERFSMCSHGGVIRLDQLCPDLCLVNIRALEIDPRELKPWARDPADGGVIGEGGFGIVSRKSYHGQKVAVKRFKEIQKQDLTPDELAKIHTAFRNEIWLMSGVSHPNIVKLIGFSLRQESIMVMEYISGGDLYEALIGNRQFTWPLRYRIALDIARGMAALHGLNPPLCHSDLKCPNCMMVDWNPQADVVAKVSDFGLSSRLYGDQLTKTPTTNPFWTAPEVLAQLPFDTSADVYSFGVILWNLVSRKALFEEMLPWTDDVSRAVRAGKRPPIPKAQGMPPEYERLIQSCWDHTPSNRPKFVDICLALELMIQKHCPELVKVVEKTRAEMTSSIDQAELVRASLFYSNAHTRDLSIPLSPPDYRVFLGHKTQNSASTIGSMYPGSAGTPSMYTARDTIRTSVVTSTWAKPARLTGIEDATASMASASLSANPAATSVAREYVIPPTYYNNSKLADYGTTLLKQLHLGSIVTLMVPVGLSQVWAFSPSMGLIYVINSVSGQFVKSFVAPKDLKYMIEVDVREGSSEVWAAGSAGLFIWHSETAQLLPHSPSSVPLASLLFIYKPDRRSVVWAGVANAPQIQIWSATTKDLHRLQKLSLPDPSHPIAAPVPIHHMVALPEDDIKTLTPAMAPSAPPTPTRASAPSIAFSSSSGSSQASTSTQTTNQAVKSSQKVPLDSASRASSVSSLGTAQLASGPLAQHTPPAPSVISGSFSTRGGIPNTQGGALQAASANPAFHSRSHSAATLAITTSSTSQSTDSPSLVQNSLSGVGPTTQTKRANSTSFSGDFANGVHAMVRTPESVWVSAGSYIFRLNRNTGQPCEQKVQEPANLEDSEQGILASSTSNSSEPATKFLPVLLAHAGGTHALVYTGLQRVWTCGGDGSLKIWDSNDGTLLRTVYNYFPSQLLVVDRTQIWALQPTGTTVDIWNLDTCELVSRMDTAHSLPLNRAMLVFNKTVWTAGQDETLHVFT